MGERRGARGDVRLVRTLERDGISYAIAGAMLLNAHGYQRVTTDVHVSLTKHGLPRFP
jgi:hypothetical protein